MLDVILAVSDDRDNHQIEFVPIDLNAAVPANAAVNLIVHKVSDILALSRSTTSDASEVKNARDQISRFHQWCQISTCGVIDPLNEAVVPLMNRVTMLDLLSEICKDIEVSVPTYKFIGPCSNALEDLNVPVMIKSVEACSSKASHEMTIAGIGSENIYLNEQVIVQEFIKHHGILYKVYVVDNSMKVVARPSFIEAPPGVTKFDSQIIPKVFGNHGNPLFGVSCTSRPDLTAEQLEQVGMLIKKVQLIFSGTLTMYGIDVIVSEQDGELYAIDLNYFPGFEEFPDFHRVFAALIMYRLS